MEFWGIAERLWFAPLVRHCNNILATEMLFSLKKFSCYSFRFKILNIDQYLVVGRDRGSGVWPIGTRFS